MSDPNVEGLRTLKHQLRDLGEAKESLIRERRRWEETPNDAHPLVRAAEIGLDAIVRAETAIRLGIAAASLSVDLPLAIQLRQHAQEDYRECIRSAMALLARGRTRDAPVKDHTGVQKAADRLAQAAMWDKVLQSFPILDHPADSDH